ncbi:hypothetical protein MICRO8M_100080 [Microbacterium sp. 8M]|nr:hypothetical protein MICRO8M_100080 [Microbacterium sp. 8M]
MSGGTLTGSGSERNRNRRHARDARRGGPDFASIGSAGNVIPRSGNRPAEHL